MYKETIITKCEQCPHNHPYTFNDGFHDGKVGSHCDLLFELPKGCPKMEAKDDYKCICGLGEEHTADCATYNSGREEGIKKVVEWIEKNLFLSPKCHCITCEGWQVKLKEWGLLRQEMPK